MNELCLILFPLCVLAVPAISKRLPREGMGKTRLAEGMGLGMCLGVCMSAALHGETALGMSLGMLIGETAGMFMEKEGT